MKQIKPLLLILFISLIACDIIDNDSKPDENIYKIINNNNFDKAYFASKVIQTSDNGFLIIGSNYEDTDDYVWLTPYIVKLNNKGAMEWEQELSSPYVNPIGLCEINGIYYIVCMDEITLGTHIFSITESGDYNLIKTLDDLMYPLALVKTPDNGVAIQGYERFSRNTTLNKLNSSFELEWTQKYPLIENSEEYIIGHISKRGKQYPFFLGYAGDNSVDYYYVNGFYKYSFSLMFADNSGNFTGVTNGFRYTGAISSAYHITNDDYFLSMFYKGNNYILPLQTLQKTEISSIEAFEGSIAPKLMEDAIIVTKKINYKGNETIVYATNSKNNHILLMLYDAASGEYITTKEYADFYPIEINDIIESDDGGLAIIGKTYITGRLARIFFLKISKNNLEL